MIEMTATEVARNFSRVLDSMENGEKEIAITRNRRTVARLVPEEQQPDICDVLEKIYSIIPEEESAAWMADIEEGRQRLSNERRDPWEE